MSDLISRQAAIDALMEFDKKLRKINWYQYPYTEHECRGVDKAIVKIANLPSAQPEIHMQIGWICPICGRGLSPLTSVCPCNNGKGWEITC